MTLTHSHRQPTPLQPADVARGSEPPREPRCATGGDSHRVPAGTLSPAQLARALRLYGGVSLEAKRDDAHTAVVLSGVIGLVAFAFAVGFPGAGIHPTVTLGFGICAVIAGVMFLEAAARRNLVQARIDDVEAKVTQAVEAALARAG